jgi:hypothetical protein
MVSMFIARTHAIYHMHAFFSYSFPLLKGSLLMNAADSSMINCTSTKSAAGQVI